MIDEKLYFRAPLLALLSAFCLSACTDYAEQYEGDYKADYGDAEAFERHLNDATMWNLGIGCQSDGYVWEWCYESDGKYAFTTSAGASWESFVEGDARLDFAGRDNSGHDYTTNLLTDGNVLHMLRRSGGLRVEVSMASGDFSAGVQVKLQNNELYKPIYPGIFVGYTNECDDAFIGLKYVDDDGKVVSEYRWDKLSVGEAIGSLWLFDELHYVAGEKDSDFLKKANTFEVGLSGCSDTHKGVVIYALAVMYDPQNEGKSNNSVSSSGSTTNSNGGSTAKSSSSSGNVTQNSSDGSGKSSSSVTSNGSTTTSSSVNSSSSEKGFLWRGENKNSVVQTDVGSNRWYVSDEGSDEYLVRSVISTPTEDPYSICYGMCGQVTFGTGKVSGRDTTPSFGMVGFSLSSNGESRDVADKWEGVCIAYASDGPATLYLSIGSEDSLYKYAMPMIKLQASDPSDGAYKIVQEKWSAFKQPSWYTGNKTITGIGAAAKLNNIHINFDGKFNTTQYFNIYQIGSYGRCDSVKTTWNRDKFTTSLSKVERTEPYAPLISDDNLLWYGGNKMKGKYSYLVQPGFTENLQLKGATDYILWEDTAVTDQLIKKCGGAICASVANTIKNATSDAIISFELNDAAKAGGIKDWGGICVTYSSMNNEMRLNLGRGYYDEYVNSVLLDPTGGKMRDTCFSWLDFVKDSNGVAMKKADFWEENTAIQIVLNKRSFSMRFNIVAIGKYPAGKTDYFAWDYMNSKTTYNTFTDSRDNQVYRYVKIGSQEWMAENMNYSGYDGVCAGNAPKNCAKYGRLYPPKDSVCPTGWHLPNKGDFDMLFNAVGGKDGAAAKLMSTTAWKNLSSSVGTVTDEYGFSATPGGYASTGSSPTNLNSEAHFWGTQDDITPSLYDYMYINYSGSAEMNTEGSLSRKSIRCVKNPSSWSYLNSSMTYGTFTDTRDNKTYKTIVINNQTWMAENLNFKYKNGTSSWCHDNDTLKCELYGRLYTWEAAYKVCPDGWHLPSKSDYVSWFKSNGATTGNGDYSSYKLKTTRGWNTRNGTNADGFSALPAGYNYVSNSQGFGGTGDYAYFWTSTDDDGDSDNKAYRIDLSHDLANLHYNVWSKKDGLSVRCVRGSSYDAKNGTLTDFRDGRVYKTTVIGDQTWMAEDLGILTTDSLGQRNTYCHETGGIAGTSCAYNAYTWGTAMGFADYKAADSLYMFKSYSLIDKSGVGYNPPSPYQGICPDGWHIPTYTEFNTLLTYATQFADNHSLDLEKVLKSKSWDSGTDNLGFGASIGNVSQFTLWGVTEWKTDYLSEGDHPKGVTAFIIRKSSATGDKVQLSYGVTKTYDVAVRCLKDN